MGDRPPLDPDTEAAVFAATRRAFASRGLRFAPYDIAAEVGIESRVLTARWPRTAFLVAEVLGREAAFGDIPDVGDSRAELSSVIERMIGNYTPRPAVHRALLRLAVTCDRNAAEHTLVRELGERYWRGAVTAVMHRAVARGDLPPDTDIETVVDVLAGAISYQVTYSERPYAVQEYLLDLVLASRVPLRQRTASEPENPGRATALRWLSSVPVGRTVSLRRGVPVGHLVAAPEHRTTIGDVPVRVTAGVSRDARSPSTGLSVGVSVTAEGAGILPPSLRADRIVVLHGGEAWVAPLEEGRRSSQRFGAKAGPGPRWDAGGLVDIVVRLDSGWLPETGSRQVGLVRVSGEHIQEYF